MEPYTRNGSIIGVTMDFSDFELQSSIQYVGGSTTSGLGTTSNITVSLTSLAGGLSSSPAQGDMVIVVLTVASALTRNITYRISGYTQIADLFADDTYEANLQVGYKIMTSTPDTSVTITGGTGDTSDAYAIAVHVWRGVDQTTPLDVTSTTTTQLNTAIPDPPAITPTTPGSMILVAAGTAHQLGVQTFGASYLSNFITAGGDDTYDATVGIGNVRWTSGTYDPAPWTFSGVNDTAYSTASVTMALRPQRTFSRRSGIWDLTSVYSTRYQQFVDSLGITLVGATSSTGTSITLPSGLQQNDVVFIASASDGTTQNLPTGYTNGQNGVAIDTFYRWSYKVMGATPDTTASGLSSTSVHIAFAFRGVNTTNIFDQTTPSVASGTGGMPNPPAIITQRIYSNVVCIGFLDDDIVASATPPANYEPIIVATYGSSGNGATIMAAYTVAAVAGSYNPGTFNGSGNDEWAAATFAIRSSGVP